MNPNDEIFKKIQESLQAAREALKLKERISSDISEVLSIVPTLTDNAVSFAIIENDGSFPKYNSCGKIVQIFKKSNPLFGFILCGYTIDEVSGYPVSVENEKTIFTCSDDSALKSVLTDLITEKGNSMKIINLISAEDIPF